MPLGRRDLRTEPEPEPEPDAGQVDAREVVTGGLLEARRDRAAPLQAVKEDLDDMALPVEAAVDPASTLAFRVPGPLRVSRNHPESRRQSRNFELVQYSP